MPNEPVWPIWSLTQAFLFFPLGGVVTRQQSYLTVGNHPTSPSANSFPWADKQTAECDTLSSSFLVFFKAPPFGHLANEVGGGLRVSLGGVYLTTDRSCSGIISSTCGPTQR